MSAAGRQRIVGGADELHLLLEVPIVEDHAHRDDVRLGQRIMKKSPDAVPTRSVKPAGGNVLSRDGFDGRQIEARCIRDGRCFFATSVQSNRRAADIAQRVDSGRNRTCPRAPRN